jgi:hypothetical protein
MTCLIPQPALIPGLVLVCNEDGLFCAFAMQQISEKQQF